jgi:hypothetical protein
VSKSPLEIHKLKYVEAFVVLSRFGKTCTSVHLMTITWNILNEMERKHEIINVKLTFVVKCFHKWKEPCNPCRYIQDQNFKKLLFQLIALFARTCGFKFFCCIVDNPIHFYLYLEIMTYFNHFFLVNCNFLVAINLGWTHSTCVLIGVALLHLWYSISFFFNNTSLGK